MLSVSTWVMGMGNFHEGRREISRRNEQTSIIISNNFLNNLIFSKFLSRKHPIPLPSRTFPTSNVFRITPNIRTVDSPSRYTTLIQC